MIKLRIKKKIKDGSIIEEVIYFKGTYDGKLLTHEPDELGVTWSWIPYFKFDDWEVIEQVNEN